MYHRFQRTILSGLLLTTPIVTNPAQANSNPLSDTFPALRGIELTPVQQQKLTRLGHQTLTEVRMILSPQQQAKFDRTLATGVGLKKSLMACNLSLSQQWQLRNLLTPKQQQIEAILTPAQQQQARQNIYTQP